MPSLQSLVAFAALFATAVASPVDMESLEKRKTFSINQTPRGHVLKNGAISMQKTFLKYNVPVPDHIAAAAATTGIVTGSAAANPELYDQEYLTPVTVGGNTLNLDFDTGSADLWVFSTLLPTAQRSRHDVYDPSTGSLKSGYSWRISYGDGSGASGKVYADKVVVGGVTATSQAVEAATSISTQFQQDVNNDGLLGLAFSSINTVSPQPQTTFFDTVKSSLASPLFAVTLKKGAPGTYDFGYIDSSKYTGSLAYVNVDTSNGFWQFTTSGYRVGSGSTVSSSFSGIADTGTTLVYLPSTVVSAYYSQVSGAKNSQAAGGWVFPCTATLPSFTAVIGGQARTVPGSYINYAPVSGSTCFGGIQPNTGIGFTIYGDIFLKSQYVVFDASVPRLGFAQQA